MQLTAISTLFHMVPTLFQNKVETPFVSVGNGVDGTESLGTESRGLESSQRNRVSRAESSGL